MTIDAPAIPIADSDSRHSGPDAGRRPPAPQPAPVRVYVFLRTTIHPPLEAHPRPSSTP